MVQEAEVPRCGMVSKIIATSFKSLETVEVVSEVARSQNDFIAAIPALPATEERSFSQVFPCDVAQALVPTPACETMSQPRTGVQMSLDTAVPTACATSGCRSVRNAH